MIRTFVLACALALAVSLTMGAGAASALSPPAQHVLLLSVDGLHQSDLTWYVQNHPQSALATLAGRGVDFSNASAPVPSDSFPGLIGQVTGGNPSTTGIYYDDTYNHALLPAGTTSCYGVHPGTEVNYTEALDKNPHALDAGQGLTGLPGSILQMTGNPTSLIDPAKLPVDPGSCQPVYPHSYLKVNTIFEVARAAGLRTAWSDDHPAYDVLNGPSGTGVQDLFTPELNSSVGSGDWTSDNLLTQEYDSFKVQAVLNEIGGFDHSGANNVGTPALFGTNFQTVSTAQKLPRGGYLADGVTPGPLLSHALDFVNGEIGAVVSTINRAGLKSSTAIVLSAKNGQSPQSPLALTRIDDKPILAALDAAWEAANPGAGPLVAKATDDDGMLLWLTDRSPDAAEFAKSFLLAQSGTGTDIQGAPKAYTASGLSQVFAGADAATQLHALPFGPRVPDVFGISQVGVVYTSGQTKIAEHGGANPQDLNVPILVAGDPVARRGTDTTAVETTAIAPTILGLLGLSPNALKAVCIEHTRALTVQ